MDFTGSILEKNDLKKMGAVIKHRGPDDEGYFSDTFIGFAFRRLSIIDLKGGHQPMIKDNLVVVYNGELYNYKLIKKELEALGHYFVTQSDTEVLLTAYIEWGINALSRFNGMWAFAIWDRTEKSLFLARDRLGIKPLYIARNNKKLFFSSEIKAILEGGFPAEINKEDLAEFFHFGYIAGERTMFKNIFALLPGTWVKYSPDTCSTGKYWEVSNEANTLSLRKEEVQTQVLQLLEDSVSFRLISDVPVGALLSGGVDSSILSLIASQKMSHERLHTFNVAMEEDKYDESGYAQDAAILCNSFHQNISIAKDEYISILPYVAWLHDEPIDFSNALYMLCVCKLAREDNVKVLLSGEGADELFGGYIRYSKTLERLKGLQSRFTKDELLILGSAVYGYDKVKSLFGSTDWENPRRKDCYRRFKHLTEEDILMRLDQTTRLDSLLCRQDRMSMGVGVEARIPFLDYRLVELANNLYSDFKINENESKILLKELAVKLGFKSSAIYRPKLGFPTPVEDWLKQKDFSPFIGYIGRGDSSASELYDIDFAKKLVTENYEGKGEHGTIIWLLLSFEIWSRIFIDKSLKINFEGYGKVKEHG